MQILCGSSGINAEYGEGIEFGMWKKTAREVVSLLKNGEVSPSQLIDVVEQRWLETEPLVHATPIPCFQRAREKAKSFTIPENPPPYFLYGLPILCKDEIAVRDVILTEGSTVFKDRVAEQSCLIVEELEKNGAIVVGKTNQPEFAAGGVTFNSVFGTTFNPWDLRLTCGGSSGGSASALACGQCWLAVGTDLGGSLRIPASFCGIVGFRSSPGRVIGEGSEKPERALHTINGPLARNVSDLALFLDAMQGSKGWAFELPPVRSFLEVVDNPTQYFRNRFAWSATLSDQYPVDPEVVEICSSALTSLARVLGATLQVPSLLEARAVSGSSFGRSWPMLLPG
eukprot:TRINITY_DN619_c1_g2_i2.p1 TRINITY_DN619_c1_g2~~TRINITY_DN619_c1_g2_i2.p1  ORF type:complete len:341 (-),score=82.25 TRINITY_DN619_c1_g2_i2:979-2001(-)